MKLRGQALLTALQPGGPRPESDVAWAAWLYGQEEDGIMGIAKLTSTLTLHALCLSISNLNLLTTPQSEAIAAPPQTDDQMPWFFH